MDFDQFLGNQTAVRLLRAAASGRRPGHAYLFSGTEGTGKRTLAGIFAKALLCGGRNEKPCGRCSACLKFDKGVHPDFTEVRKPSDKNFIVVEQIRTLREEVYIRPNEADHRVVLIENCEAMNPAAANALLKVLEEPPAYVVFLLTVSNSRLIPETIVSRCTQVELFEVPLAEAEGWIEQNFPAVSPADRKQAALYGSGNLGKSRAFLENPAVKQSMEQAFALAKALTFRREYDVMAALAPFDGDKAGLLRMLDDFDGLLGRIARIPFIHQEDPQAAMLAEKISPMQAAALHDELDGIRKALFFNGNCALTNAVLGARLRIVMETQA